MLKLFDVARKAVAYRKTRTALEALSAATLRDLNIDPGEIKRIARDAVYGQPKVQNAYAPRAQMPRFLVNPARA